MLFLKVYNLKSDLSEPVIITDAANISRSKSTFQILSAYTRIYSLRSDKYIFFNIFEALYPKP